MGEHTFRVAKRICEFGDWDVSNLKLQKILYLSHMFHLGTVGEPLITGLFEAWDAGPVQPHLYHRVKGFGSRAVGNVFHGVSSITDEAARRTIDEACRVLLPLTAGRLVAITHDPAGAWAKNYRAGIKGIIIPNEDIQEEYRSSQTSIA